jgi:hypothetical protein
MLVDKTPTPGEPGAFIGGAFSARGNFPFRRVNPGLSSGAPSAPVVTADSAVVLSADGEPPSVQGNQPNGRSGSCYQGVPIRATDPEI